MLNLTFKQNFFRNVTAILLSKSALQTVCRSLMKKDYSCALSQKCSAPCRTLKSTYFFHFFDTPPQQAAPSSLRKRT